MWDEATYRRFSGDGCEGVVVYQETYDPDTYTTVHVKGKKRNYGWRLEAPERAAAAGMRRLGLGVLLGLAGDWRADVVALVAHARHLQRVAWRTEITVALPRLRPCAGGTDARCVVTDREFVQALCTLRVALPEAGIVRDLLHGDDRPCVRLWVLNSARERSHEPAAREVAFARRRSS